MSARRDPFHVFVFAASLFAFAYATPQFELALLLERYTTRAGRRGEIYRFRVGYGPGGPGPRVTFKCNDMAVMLRLQVP